jgi:DnaD/phage-associated family protein
MARPRKEGLEYFSHDTDASSDEKIDAMRALFGNDGYAFYFILCERIYRTSNAELDVSKHVLLTPIVKKLLVSEDKFEEMLDASFHLDLFSRQDYEERGVITSNGIKKRFREVSQMRDRWRKHKQNSSEKEVFHAENAGENHMDNAEETGESKVKQSKVKEIEIINNRSSSNSENPFTIFVTHGFGKLDEITREFVCAACEDYSEAWVIRAMKEAVALNKTIWRYVERTLQRWKATNHPEPWTLEKQDEKPKAEIIQHPRSQKPNPKNIPIVQPGPAAQLSDDELAEIKRKAQQLDERFNKKKAELG